MDQRTYLQATFLVPRRGAKKRAHIWVGRDTLCRMASTGGLNPRRYAVQQHPDNRQLCFMCAQALDGAKLAVDARPANTPAS